MVSDTFGSPQLAGALLVWSRLAPVKASLTWILFVELKWSNSPSLVL